MPSYVNIGYVDEAAAHENAQKDTGQLSCHGGDNQG
jgi:hypothetical protein